MKIYSLSKETLENSIEYLEEEDNKENIELTVEETKRGNWLISLINSGINILKQKSIEINEQVIKKIYKKTLIEGI